METRAVTAPPIPEAFIWRRLHSLTGIWLTGYIIFHLLTNSQSALWFGEDGRGFIRAVNAIQEMPYLPVLEFIILAVPILIHAIWGIKYALTAKMNSFGSTGKTPYLPEYPRNHSYTWQRITAWLLIIGIAAHVIHMRFIDRPLAVPHGTGYNYIVKIDKDAGLTTLAARLGVTLYDQQQIDQQKGKSEENSDSVLAQEAKLHNQWVSGLKKYPLRPGEIIAVSDNYGTAELLVVRETFKMPIMIVLYTLLVLAACYHGFNGLWTFMISWGITLTKRSQDLMMRVAVFLMVLVALLGLSSVWLTYWVNLKQ